MTIRDVAARALRNALQTLLPLLALASAGQITGASAGAALAAAGIASGVSVLKALSGLQVDATAPLAGQLAERAGAAAAGAALAVIPLDLAGVLSADWRTIAVTIGGSVALSIISWSMDHLPADQAPAASPAGGHLFGDR